MSPIAGQEFFVGEKKRRNFLHNGIHFCQHDRISISTTDSSVSHGLLQWACAHGWRRFRWGGGGEGPETEAAENRRKKAREAAKNFFSGSQGGVIFKDEVSLI